MIIVSQACIILSICYLIKVFLYPFFKSASKKQKKKARNVIKARKDAKAKQRVDGFKNDIIAVFGKFMITGSRKERYKKLIDRLDIVMTPEELALKQWLYALLAAMGSVVAFQANQLMGYISISLIFIMWMLPLDDMYKKVQERDKNITLGFPAFYSMVYYQYSKSVNIFMSDIIRDYLPNANPDLAYELNVMLDNAEYGEEYALKQFKKRVPLHFVIKFCDIMQTRLNGYDNVNQMTYFKEEIDEYRVLALEKELSRRQAANDKIQLILILILAVYLIIYFGFMVIESINMFSL